MDQPVVNVLVVDQNPRENVCVIDENGMPWWSHSSCLAHPVHVQGELTADADNDDCWIMELGPEAAATYLQVTQNIIGAWKKFREDPPSFEDDGREDD